MKERFLRFMYGRYGRYGQDNLNKFLYIVVLILLFASIFTRWLVLDAIGVVLLVFWAFRIFSKNIGRRTRENQAYLSLRGKVTGFFSNMKLMFSQRKTHRFYKCPSCHAKLRVPKGAGRISIKCPKCRTAFERKA